MQTLAVGTRWDTADVPLPEIAPLPDRGPLGAELTLAGDLIVDESRDPLVAQVADRAGEARWLAAMSARYDERLAATYLRGAGELASRSSGRTDAERRQWGARAMLAELACALQLPETTLARRLTRITMLAAFPRLREAAESGRVSSWHCDVMLDVFAGVTDPDVLARADGALIEKALTATAPQLRAAARRWRARHVPRTDEQRKVALADRRVELTPADDDLVWLSALIPATAGVAIDHRLDAVATAAAGGPDDERTSQQVRADAFVDLLLGVGAPVLADDEDTVACDEEKVACEEDTVAAADGADAVRRAETAAATSSSDQAPLPEWVLGIRPEVVVTVPVLSLLGHSDEPADLEGFGPIDPETARQLCAAAPSFVRVLTHPETGAVLSVGRGRYRIPADLRRAVQMRDVTCRFPGCRRPARRCDVDHSTAWQDGGSTALCNLACLCRKHHRLKHEMGWRVAHEPGGVLRWRSALGREYRTEPGTRWPPPPRVPDPRPSASGGRAAPASGYPDEPPF